MKKVIFTVALAAMFAVGCNNGATSKVNGTDSTAVQVDSVGVDSLKVDSVGGETPRVEPVQPIDAASVESVK
jgi:PBP1b-binding outer membrane lipoprotein LpoB